MNDTNGMETEKELDLDLELNTKILLGLITMLSNLEQKIDNLEKEEHQKEMQQFPGFTLNSNPTLDAILMDNINQS
jgi:hypothetical protein